MWAIALLCGFVEAHIKLGMLERDFNDPVYR
jgi:hypothetical protein